MLKQKLKDRLSYLKENRTNIPQEHTNKKDEHPTITILLQMFSDFKRTRSKKEDLEFTTMFQTLPQTEYANLQEAVLNQFGNKSIQFNYACLFMDRMKKQSLKDFVTNMIQKNPPTPAVITGKNNETTSMITEPNGTIRRKFQLVE